MFERFIGRPHTQRGAESSSIKDITAVHPQSRFTQCQCTSAVLAMATTCWKEDPFRASTGGNGAFLVCYAIVNIIKSAEHSFSGLCQNSHFGTPLFRPSSVEGGPVRPLRLVSLSKRRKCYEACCCCLDPIRGRLYSTYLAVQAVSLPYSGRLSWSKFTSRYPMAA